MRIAMSEACLQKLFDLPKEVQKNTLDFKRKFELDSTLASIHLEPINTFKDKNLRTARINQKYRAIIRVPEAGEQIYYLLWVDNHDEAMDWAKNKMFVWNKQLGSAQIFIVPEETQNVVSADETAETDYLYASFSDEQLISIGVPEELLPVVRKIKDLECLDKAENDLPSDVYEHLFYLADGVSINTILAEIEDGKQVIDGDTSNNKRYFIEVDDDILAKYLNGELDKWQLFLHPIQRSLVERNFSGSVKVTGGAGTGKTVVALHRLKYLTSKKEQNVSGKVLFTTYTKSLKVNLQALIAKMDIPSASYDLENLDGLIWKLAIDYKLLSRGVHVLDMPGIKESKKIWEEIVSEEVTEYDSKFLLDEYRSVILNNNCQKAADYYSVTRIGRGKPVSKKGRMEIWSLVEKYHKRKSDNNYLDRLELFNRVTNYLIQNKIYLYDHVIVDEIQDFSNVELRFIRSLCQPKSNDLFLVGDPYQNIYTQKPSFIRSGINIRGRSKQLRINYRTTEEIKRLALSSIKGIRYDDFEDNEESLNGYLSLYHGERPQYLCLKSESEQKHKLMDIIDELHQSGVEYRDILIGARTKHVIRDLRTYLYDNQNPYYELSDNTGDPSGIRLSTFHGMKGLEAKHVILYGVNNTSAPYKHNHFDCLDSEEKKQYIQSERSLLYVAMTRAVSTLSILGSGTSSELLGV
ncbi:MAG: UvrD-helicase domain-containing protein [Bacteroidales bacterium]